MKTITFTIAVLFSTTITFSQTEIDNSKLLRAIHKTWGGDKIKYFTEHNPEYVEKGLYYFNQSFEVSLTNCEMCAVDYNQLINLDLFNVSEFEHLRQDNERVSFVFKEYSITLHSEEELENYLDEPLTSFMSGENHISFPRFDFDNQSAANLNKYKEDRKYFIINYGMKYRARRATPNYRIIDPKEIGNLSQAEINFYAQHQDQFEINLR